MNVLDWVIVVAAVLAALAGWRTGLIGGAFAAVGFAAGAVLGALVAPRVLDSVSGGLGLALALAVVLGGAAIGKAVAALVARRVQGLLPWRPIRTLDSVIGAAFGVFVVGLVTWVLAGVAITVPWAPVSSQVRGSAVIGALDRVLPGKTHGLMSGLRSALNATGIPNALAGLPFSAAAAVDPPDPALLNNRAVRHAWGSLVKIEGYTSDCDTHVDGSGFVYASDRVMTNAHVVAGVANPDVLVRGTGQVWPSSIVYLDPVLDIAVLLVPGLNAPQLEFVDSARRGDAVVIAGFPGGGALAASAGRIRAVLSTRGTDIYGDGVTTREVYSVRGTIRPGNSGGPLLSPDGLVDGVIFAAAVDDPDTGYALTAHQVAEAARRGATASTPLDPGSCATKQ